MRKCVYEKKSEAIKEFAERLKENLEGGIVYEGGILRCVIDKIVKEMTEERK